MSSVWHEFCKTDSFYYCLCGWLFPCTSVPSRRRLNKRHLCTSCSSHTKLSLSSGKPQWFFFWSDILLLLCTLLRPHVNFVKWSAVLKTICPLSRCLSASTNGCTLNQTAVFLEWKFFFSLPLKPLRLKLKDAVQSISVARWYKLHHCPNHYRPNFHHTNHLPSAFEID